MKKILLCLCCLMMAVAGFSKDTKDYKGKTVTFTYPSFLQVAADEETDSLTTISLTSDDGSEVDISLIIPTKGYTVEEYTNTFGTSTISYMFQLVGFGNFSMNKIEKGTENATIGTTEASGYNFSAMFTSVPLYGKILTCKADKNHFAVFSACCKDSALIEQLAAIAGTIKFAGMEPQEAVSATEPQKTATANAEKETTPNEETPASPDQEVLDVAEQMPVFPGGNGELMKWLGSNVVYPDSAYAKGVQGKVVASFVVEKDGSIGDVKILRSVDPDLDNEAVRAVKAMPKWNPGMQNGKAVRVKYTVPINFRMPEEPKAPDARVLNLVGNITAKYETTALGQIVDEPKTKAEFTGGEDALNGYVAEHLYYPPNLRNFGIEDTVVLEFIVEKDGQLTNILATQYKSETLAKSALKLVQEMPVWTPATDKNGPVRSKATLQVEFKK